MAVNEGARPQDVSVLAVVVTWRAARTIARCVQSLLDQRTRAELSVLVIDNDSQDGTTAELEQFDRRIEVRRLGNNQGFAGGVAAATSSVRADYVLLLNDDAYLEPDAVDHLLDAMSPDVGAVTATLLLTGRWRRTSTPVAGALTDTRVWAVPDPEGQVLVNSTGNVLDPLGRGSDRDWLAARDGLDAPPEVFGFCGGAALLRTEALRGAGGFDPGLFLYYEDTDLSWRIRAIGWEIAWAARAIAWHEHASSTGTTSPVFRYYNSRNQLRVTLRYAPAIAVLRAWLRALAGAAKSTVRRTEPVAARWRALRDAARSLPNDLALRRRWSPATRRTARRFLG